MTSAERKAKRIPLTLACGFPAIRFARCTGWLESAGSDTFLSVLANVNGSSGGRTICRNSIKSCPRHARLQ